MGFASVEGVHCDCDCDCFTGEMDVLPLVAFSGDEDTDEALDEVEENDFIELSDVEREEEPEDEKEYVEEP